MATVHIPTLLRTRAGGSASFSLAGNTVGELLDALDALHPGLRAELLRPNVAIVVDDEVTPLGVLERVGPEAEVFFVAAVSGGA